jgi:hypothetical protein
MELRHLKELARRHRVRTEAHEASREELAAAIRETAAEGARQVDIVEATGYTREQIRRIVAGRTR